jgi:Zn-dependent protease with chaperone function
MRQKARAGTILAVLALLAGCAPMVTPAPYAPPVVPSESPASGAKLAAEAAAENFRIVVDRVEPVAEAICRQRASGIPCNLQIVVDNRPGMPPNAFQTVDRLGRPIVGFTLALIGEARNADEIAFVLGHEAAHHISGHIPRQAQQAMSGAMMAGVLATMSGEDEVRVREAQMIGGAIAARTFSRDFELEADALGAEIALLAGFDPVRGAAYFARLPDPGDRFLGSHPPNAQRIELIRAHVARLRAGG